MSKLRFILYVFITFLISGTLLAQNLSQKELLGKLIFFDTNLSDPAGESCASCHAPEVGFTGPNSNTNNTTVVYPGAIPTRFGNRKPPTAAYGGESPVFYFDERAHLFIGGMFWDGRATGWELGDPLAEQARGPFLNPVEQNNASKLDVVNKVRYESSYAGLFVTVYGPDIWNNTDNAYNKIADAISAYEQSSEVNPFTSKYDYYLKKMVKLTKEEQKGLSLFNGKGKCKKCHLSKGSPKGDPPLFTDFTYDNLGIPKNPDNPFYTQPPWINPDGENWVDKGLGKFLETVPQYSQYAAENYGKHKVPTLRNVDLKPYPGFVKAYGHNGYFKSLKSIVHFYNTRDVENWDTAEVSANVNTTELGNLRLTSEDEDAIVAFLKTLSDGYILEADKNVIAEKEPNSNPVLLQNAPNPFNPATVISFELPEDIYVTLKVYSIIGQEITTLVNEKLSAGRYEVEWNGSGYTSGVYIYKLIAGDFVDIKKMVLIK